jgi:soluble lytic murein transglycosylase-like protein
MRPRSNAGLPCPSADVKAASPCGAGTAALRSGTLLLALSLTAGVAARASEVPVTASAEAPAVAGSQGAVAAAEPAALGAVACGDPAAGAPGCAAGGAAGLTALPAVPPASINPDLAGIYGTPAEPGGAPAAGAAAAASAAGAPGPAAGASQPAAGVLIPPAAGEPPAPAHEAAPPPPPPPPPMPGLGFDASLGVPKGRYGKLIYQMASRYSLNPMLVAALIHVESDFNPRARSRKGALGLMQLLPKTARRFGILRRRDLLNPRKNLEAGARYLRWLIERFGEDPVRVLAAYNAGEGAVDRFGGVPPFAETRDYVQRIFAHLGFTAVLDLPATALSAVAGSR